MTAARARVFYGWWVTAAFSVMVFASTGVRHAVGPFLKPMVADLHVDRASFSLVIALGLFLYGVFMPLVGGLVDRVGARAVTAGGAIVLAGSLALTGVCRTIWDLALVYGVLAAVGLAATGPVVANAVVSRWFVARRGTAVSVLGSASMTGMSLLVPVVTWLILSLGWRMTYLAIALFVLVGILPLCLLVVRDSPESMGLCPDGAPEGPGGRAGRAERTPVGTAAHTVAFWQLSGSFLTCGFSMSLLSAHGIPMLTDHGYTPLFSSWVLGVLGASSILFTMLLGTASDHFGRRPVLAAIYAGRALAFAGLFLIRDNPAAILAVAVFGGTTTAGTMSMTSALTADIYGRFSVGTILGAIFLMHQTGAAIGSWLAGALFEVTGGYGVAYAIACAILVGAALVSLRIDDGRRRLSWTARAARA
ncbi:MAG: MFS transporter [Candidatus Rokubacteria bacterium]|nr:MFS transporter [Candidatus Rokubacteria bacterium]MBI3824833.1 MFS transporter [Candidatus Rokubacteria bacterium]